VFYLPCYGVYGHLTISAFFILLVLSDTSDIGGRLAGASSKHCSVTLTDQLKLLLSSSHVLDVVLLLIKKLFS